jgi:hypothetical protein
MPSYRITVSVGVLRAGVAPASVLPTAAGAAREMTTVESSDLDVVAGEARLTVRFTAPDDDEATAVANRVRTAVGAVASVYNPRVTRRWGARWNPVR